MKNLTALIGWILLVAGLGVYLCGIIFAIFFPIEDTQNGQVVMLMPEALETVTTSVGAILLTNLGAVLGISIVKPNNGLARVAMKSISVPEPITMREAIQIAAVLLYIISLLACGIKWGIATFKQEPDPVVALIPQYAKTLIGVITAYIAFVLAINSNTNTNNN